MGREKLLSMCPLGVSGDVIIGRETWCYSYNIYDGSVIINELLFKADGQEVFACDEDGCIAYNKNMSPKSPWLSATPMPRELSRIRMVVKAVDVKRFDEQRGYADYTTRKLEWNKRFPATPWADNPWCWRVEVEQ